MTVAARVDEAKLESLRVRTLFVLWATYGSFYLCRVNVSPAVPSIRQSLGLGAIEISLVLGAVKLGYAMGQFVNGQLTERFGARRILGVGMLGSAVVTMLFAIAPSVPGVATVNVMIALAFANGWFQAGGWPPTVKIAARWFPVEHRGRTMGILGTSYTLGSAVAFFLVGGLLDAAHGAWRVAFVVPGLLLAASYVHTYLRLREAPPELTRDGAPHRASAGEAHLERLTLRDSFLVTVRNRYIWILALGLFGADAVRYGFLDWAPSHLAEVQHTGALSAAAKTAVFAVAGAAGTLTSSWATDRFFQSRRAPVCALLLVAVAVLTIAYRGVVALGTAPTIACLALVGFGVYGAQILLVGTAAQDFARRGATAAAAGFVDFMGHVGAFSGDVLTGLLRKHYGWAGATAWWAFAAAVAGLLVATLWRARPALPAGEEATAGQR
jgi:OPA family glycerol-3-phosphate transporter-like MFS transporter